MVVLVGRRGMEDGTAALKNRRMATKGLKQNVPLDRQERQNAEDYREIGSASTRPNKRPKERHKETRKEEGKVRRDKGKVYPNVVVDESMERETADPCASRPYIESSSRCSLHERPNGRAATFETESRVGEQR